MTRPLTAEQVELIRHSWMQIHPIRETAGPMFYGKLFELAPELRPLFKGDIGVQADKLFETLNAVVMQFDSPQAFALQTQALGRSHARFAATAAQYEALGQALLWTLQAGLGTLFTEPARAAWAQAYEQLAQAMQAAAGAGTAG